MSRQSLSVAAADFTVHGAGRRRSRPAFCRPRPCWRARRCREGRILHPVSGALSYSGSKAGSAQRSQIEEINAAGGIKRSAAPRSKRC